MCDVMPLTAVTVVYVFPNVYIVFLYNLTIRLIYSIKLFNHVVSHTPEKEVIRSSLMYYI